MLTPLLLQSVLWSQPIVTSVAQYVSVTGETPSLQSGPVVTQRWPLPRLLLTML